MIEKTIQDDICEKLSSDDQKIALDFVCYLKENGMIFFKDNHGYWKDKIYYWVKFRDQCVCFIAIKNPEEQENRWTVWSDNMKSASLACGTVSKEIREAAWRYVDHCGNCGSCGGGRRKTIFGKEFTDVCGCTFRIDNPVWEDLPFLEKMAEIRKTEIINSYKTKENNHE